MRKNWIGIAIFFAALILLERGINEIRLEEEKLLALKQEIEMQKNEALSKKMHLERQIMSQSDPNWITLTLIRELGVIPEGQTKVYFKPGSKL